MPHRLSALLLAFVLMLPLLPAPGQAESSLRPLDQYSYVLREDGTAQITGYESPSSDMVIPSELELPAGTEIIGAEAFEGCPDLTLTAPENSAAERYCLENDISFLPLGEE